MNLTYYEILNVPPAARPEEILAAYRKLFIERHPDRVPEDQTDARQHAEQGFEIFTEAFALLSHPRMRAQYDALLRGEQPFRKKRCWARKKHVGSGPQLVTPDTPEAALREERLKALERKKRLLIAAGIALCLAPLAPLLIAGGKWAQATGIQAWWHTTSLASNSEGWWVEDLRFYPLSTYEQERSPDAVVTLRGYIKGLPGCYVVPASGTVISETNGRATIRVELERLGQWNKTKSFMGTCREGFASIEAYLAGNMKAWETIDLVAVDTDIGLERVFAAPEVQWHVKR